MKKKLSLTEQTSHKCLRSKTQAYILVSANGYRLPASDTRIERNGGTHPIPIKPECMVCIPFLGIPPIPSHQYQCAFILIHIMAI